MIKQNRCGPRGSHLHIVRPVFQNFPGGVIPDAEDNGPFFLKELNSVGLVVAAEV